MSFFQILSTSRADVRSEGSTSSSRWRATETVPAARESRGVGRMAGFLRNPTYG